MAAKSRAVSVATTATRVDSSTGDAADGISGQSCAVYNNGSATVYVGASDVTTANGWPLAAGTSMTFDLNEEGVYGIVASGTVEVRVFEVGV